MSDYRATCTYSYYTHDSVLTLCSCFHSGIFVRQHYLSQTNYWHIYCMYTVYTCNYVWALHLVVCLLVPIAISKLVRITNNHSPPLGRLSALTPPLSRSFTCKLLSRFPDKQLSWNHFDEAAIRTVRSVMSFPRYYTICVTLKLYNYSSLLWGLLGKS